MAVSNLSTSIDHVCAITVALRYVSLYPSNPLESRRMPLATVAFKRMGKAKGMSGDALSSNNQKLDVMRMFQ